MKKKLLILLSLIFSIIVTGVSATACGDQSEESGTNSEFTSDSTPDSTPSITLSETSLNLDLYASATLTATLENSDEELVWLSSDESVAKVVGGVVTAYKTGSATITVKAGTLEKTCQVTVGAMGTFVFSELEETINLMKGSSMPLDLTLLYEDDEFTMAEISVQTEGEYLSYADEILTAVEYGTQNLVVTAKVNGAVVHTHTIAVTVFESGSVDVQLEGEDIGLKINGEGFDLSNFKAMVNGEPLENPNFTISFGENGIVKEEDGKLCPVAEGTTTVTVTFTTTQGSYNRVVSVRVYKETIALGEFLVKGDAGKDAQNIGLAPLDLSGKELDLQDVEKVYVNGEETTDYTISDAVITFTNPEGGSNAIILETAVERYVVNACFYGHSLSTLDELKEWRTGNIAAYTVLLNDIDCQGETLATLESGYKAGLLDGLGHTVYNFMLKKGFLHGIDATGGIKNIQFVNFIQDCSAAGAGAVGFGILATDNGGTIENVLLKGKLVNVPNADHYGLIYKGALENSVCKNVFAELYTDGLGNHYTGPMWTVANDNYTLSNVAIVFNGSPYHRDFNPTQVISYANMDEFAENVELSLWNGWTLEEGKFFMNEYDDSKYSVFSFGDAILGESIEIYSSGFAPITYEVTEGADMVTLNENVLTIPLTATIGTKICVAAKDAEGNVIKTFDYIVTLDASLYVKGKALIGETVEFLINSNLPAEMFTIEILEGGEYGTLNGTFLTINNTAEVGSVIKIKVSCSADASWGDVFNFVVSKEVVVEETLFNPTSSYTGTVATDVTAPEGFENVHKYEGTDAYIHGGNYSAKNLDNYSLVTFAVKSPNFRVDTVDWDTSNEWLVFTLTKTGTALWDLEVTQNGETVYTASGMSGNRDGAPYVYNALNAIMYGVPQTGYYFAAVDGTVTAYFTEVRGITSVVEPEPEPEPVDPIGQVINNFVYVDYGFQETDEIAKVPGFERVNKYQGTGEFIHGAYFADENLDNYSLVTFALKTANFNMNSEGANTSNEWLVFTLTQVAADTWNLVVTCNDEVVYTKDGLRGAYDSSTNSNYHDNALDAILYGNPSGFSPTGVDGNLLVYTTELRGVRKPVEPVGQVINNFVYVDYGFQKTDEIAKVPGFEKVNKYQGTGTNIHGGYFSGDNLDNYSLVTFAIKTAKFNFNNESTDTSNEWLVFTLTQTDTAVWDLVVTKNGETVYEKTGLSGNRETGGAYVYNALDTILYGLPSTGYSPWEVDGNVLVYTTELRGVLAE